MDEIIKYIKEELKEEEIEEYISKKISQLDEEGKDGDLNNIYGRIKHYKVGANEIAGVGQGGFVSTDKKYISKTIKLNVTSGINGDEANLQVDDVSEVYKVLIKKVQEEPSINFEDLMRTIYDTTVEYFGSTENAGKDRPAYYNRVADTDDMLGKISDFKGKNMAACNERAALSQNLMHFLGIESIYKCSQAVVDGKNEVHAYNLVAHNGKYYIFDATIPRKEKDGDISPLITEISKEEYERLSDPLSTDSISISTEYESLKKKRSVHYNGFKYIERNTTLSDIKKSIDLNRDK